MPIQQGMKDEQRCQWYENSPLYHQHSHLTLEQMTNSEEETTEGTQKKEDYLSLLPGESPGKKGRWYCEIQSLSQVRIDEDYSHTGEAQNYTPLTIKGR